MNIPNYIKEQIDREIESLVFEENKEYQEYASRENALNNLEKIIQELKNTDNLNKNFTFTKLHNNKIIKESNILDRNTTPITLSNNFEKKTLDKKIQTLDSLYQAELKKFKAKKEPNEKIKKLDDELEKIAKNLKDKFKKIPNFINSNKYYKNKNNSNEITKYIFNEEYIQGIFEIICYYVQPSQLFDNSKNENCLHSEIRDYIIERLNQNIGNLNLEKITFDNDSENLKIIVIESKQEIDQGNQQIIDSILASLISKRFNYDSNFIQEIFFNWSKIFPNTNYSDIQNLIEKIFLEDNSSAKKFLDFFGSPEFKFICDNLDSSIGVCQIIHNKIDQNQIENHKCNQECLVNEEINDFYKKYLIEDINLFIKNYQEKKDILIKQMILGKIYDSIQKNLNSLNILLIINNDIRKNFEEKIIQNNFEEIKKIIYKKIFFFGMNFSFLNGIKQILFNKHILKINKIIKTKNKEFFDKFQLINDLNKKFNINLYFLFKNNLKEFKEILNNLDENSKKEEIKNFLKAKILTQENFNEKILDTKKKIKKLIFFCLKKIFICLLLAIVLSNQIIIYYFAYLFFKLLFEFSCAYNHYFLKFVNQDKNLLNFSQKILINLGKIFQISLIILTFLYCYQIISFLLKINNKINNKIKNLNQILEKKFDILKEKIFSKEEMKKTKYLCISNSVIFFIFKLILNIFICYFIFNTYFNLILNYNKNISPILEKLSQIQNLSEIKDFLKFENFINPGFKLFLIIFFISFAIEIIYRITQFFIELYNALNINSSEHQYDNIIDKITSLIIEMNEIKEVNINYKTTN